MSKFSKLKDSLTPEQREFFSTKTLSSTMKVRDWIGFLSVVAQLDKLVDKKIRRGNGWKIFFIVMSVIGGFMSLSGVPLIILVEIFFITMAVWNYRKVKALRKQDMSNYMREFFIPLLHLMKDKVGDKAKLSAKVDFRDPRTALDPEVSKVMNRNQKAYEPVYIIGRVAFQDGVLFEFVVQEIIKDQKWKKTSMSGKVKHKSKTKLVHLSTLKMTLPKGEYEWSGRHSDEVSVEELEENYIAKTRIKIKKIGDHVLHIHAFIESIQAIYAQFDPLNPVANAPRTGAIDEEDEVEYDDGVMLLTPYIWYGSYFDRYDYDSFDHAHYESGAYDTGDGQTVFDS